jgi:hypothetical protein
MARILLPLFQSKRCEKLKMIFQIYEMKYFNIGFLIIIYFCSVQIESTGLIAAVQTHLCTQRLGTLDLCHELTPNMRQWIKFQLPILTHPQLGFGEILVRSVKLFFDSQDKCFWQ